MARRRMGDNENNDEEADEEVNDEEEADSEENEEGEENDMEENKGNDEDEWGRGMIRMSEGGERGGGGRGGSLLPHIL